MDLQISLCLLFVFFTAGQSLNCYECFTQNNTKCAEVNTTTCPAGALGCSSMLSMAKQNGVSLTVIQNLCSPGFCVNGSVNLGYMQTSYSCCNTDLCNAQNPSVPSTDAPNGQSCYSCDELNCSNILNCTGTEDHCLYYTLQVNATQSVTLKGCISEPLCEAMVSNNVSVSCCEGNLCNAASSVVQSFTFLCCFLLFFILIT